MGNLEVPPQLHKAAIALPPRTMMPKLRHPRITLRATCIHSKSARGDKQSEKRHAASCQAA